MTQGFGARLASWARLSLVLATGVGYGGQVCAAGPSTSCHIHPPQRSAGEETPAAIVGPFSLLADCEAARASLFGELGRCHCTTGFSQGWASTGGQAPASGPDSAPAVPGPRRDGALP